MQFVFTFRNGPMSPLEIQKMVTMMAEAAKEFRGRTAVISWKEQEEEPCPDDTETSPTDDEDA
jgi:hypothetical protein